MRNFPTRSRLSLLDRLIDRSRRRGDRSTLRREVQRQVDRIALRREVQRQVDRFRNWLARLGDRLGGSAHYQPRFSLQQALFTWLGSFIGISVLAYLTLHTSYPLIAAPFGATAVLLYAVPDSPLAQPRNVICGNLLGALVCVICVALFGSPPWVMAFAVATAIKLMQLTRTLHPPGGAVALVGVMSHATWNFVLTPVLLGSLTMVICTIAFNNLVSRKPYPKHWL